MRTLGIVPARGGSKGFPRKNLALVGGEPLVARAVRIALTARMLDSVVVSTDDDEIARVAEAAGARVVDRPVALAADDSPTEDALIHVVEALSGEGDVPELVVTLEPTSPLRSAELIDRCVQLAVERGRGSVVTVSETTDVLGTVEGGVFRHLDPSMPRRRQLRTPLYVESSCVYVTRTADLLATRSVLAEPAYAVALSAAEAIDVNDALDLALAEAVLRQSGGVA